MEKGKGGIRGRGWMWEIHGRIGGRRLGCGLYILLSLPFVSCESDTGTRADRTSNFQLLSGAQARGAIVFHELLVFRLVVASVDPVDPWKTLSQFTIRVLVLLQGSG